MAVSSEGGAGWRWGNVPLPEPQVAGLIAGAVIHAVWPWPLTAGWPLRLALGGTLLVLGLGIVAWAVRAVGRIEVAAPATLVVDGPYRYSRNPMYVGWTGMYVGIALVANTAWPLVLFLIVAIAVHVIVRREERALERRFGEDYRRYRREVRRYL